MEDKRGGMFFTVQLWAMLFHRDSKRGRTDDEVTMMIIHDTIAFFQHCMYYFFFILNVFRALGPVSHFHGWKRGKVFISFPPTDLWLPSFIRCPRVHFGLQKSCSNNEIFPLAEILMGSKLTASLKNDASTEIRFHMLFSLPGTHMDHRPHPAQSHFISPLRVIPIFAQVMVISLLTIVNCIEKKCLYVLWHRDMPHFSITLLLLCMSAPTS